MGAVLPVSGKHSLGAIGALRDLGDVYEKILSGHSEHTSLPAADDARSFGDRLSVLTSGMFHPGLRRHLDQVILQVKCSGILSHNVTSH